MQEDLKNQLQNTLGLLKQRGQAAMGDLLKEAKSEIQTRLSEQGVAERWPALINILQEISPDLAPSAAGIIGRTVEPLTQWLGISVKNWDPYKIELAILPQEHLLQNNSWATSSLLAMAETACRWLIEKHAPPGDLKLLVKKVEMETMSSSLSRCIVRSELDVTEFEFMLAQLLKEKRAELYLTTMVLSSNDVLLSQAHFHFELQWSPLLK